MPDRALPALLLAIADAPWREAWDAHRLVLADCLEDAGDSRASVVRSLRPRQTGTLIGDDQARVIRAAAWFSEPLGQGTAPEVDMFLWGDGEDDYFGFRVDPPEKATRIRIEKYNLTMPLKYTVLGEWSGTIMMTVETEHPSGARGLRTETLNHFPTPSDSRKKLLSLFPDVLLPRMQLCIGCQGKGYPKDKLTGRRSFTPCRACKTRGTLEKLVPAPDYHTVFLRSHSALA